jgi:hypothetical protein
VDQELVSAIFGNFDSGEKLKLFLLCSCGGIVPAYVGMDDLNQPTSGAWLPTA